MAAVYKTIKRLKGVEYVWIENRANSAEAYVIAHAGADEATVATVVLRTGKVSYQVELPDAVKQVIEELAK